MAFLPKLARYFRQKRLLVLCFPREPEELNSHFYARAGGNRNRTNGSLNNVGTNGNYWSSVVSDTNAWNLNFNGSDSNMNSNNRANGFSVRCVQDWHLPFLS